MAWRGGGWCIRKETIYTIKKSDEEGKPWIFTMNNQKLIDFFS